MEVQLYVYDLTQGMARAMSQQLLGIHIDAVYHTSLVFDSVEYFFGRGIQTCRPGTTHHGQPMEIVAMGATRLPMDVIDEYLQSLEEVYTPESYDLFAHNCNNFTNDFGMFLVGKGIPRHITNLPQRVLDTPFGQMLKPQIDASMRGLAQTAAPSQTRPRHAATTRTSSTLSRTPEMTSTLPPHPHALLKLPTLQFWSLKPVTYSKMPPLEKLMAKLGSVGSEREIVALRSFIEKRNTNPKDAPLPDLPSVGKNFQAKLLALPVDVRFAAVDLLRCAMVDVRVAGYFAEERDGQTVPSLIKHVNELDNCPHNLRLVTIHLACNLFVSPLYVKELMKPENTSVSLLVQLITSSLLDVSHPTTRVAAASLAFNLATANYRIRREEEGEGLNESEQVELAASLLESLSNEENSDAAKVLLLAFGHLVYYAPQDGELMDLTKALDAKGTVSACKVHETLAKEVASLL